LEISKIAKGKGYMEFSGSQTINVPIEKVWVFLMDVNNVAGCAPGFQSLEVLGEEHWKAVVGVSIGAVKANFTLDVTRPVIEEPEHMLVKGRGKAPGNAVELSGDMHLRSLGEDKTQMDWQAVVVVSGTLASVGARLMSGAAERLTNQFFACLQEKLQRPTEEQI
jgi:uncharacterized protein